MRYLVMRRTMTGSYEDCGEVDVDPTGLDPFDVMTRAQEQVGDGPGCYRVIVNPEEFVGYVNVEATVSRSVVDAPPPLDPESPDVAAARRLQSVRPGMPGGATVPTPALEGLPT
jgi:hypothetical protein